MPERQMPERQMPERQMTGERQPLVHVCADVEATIEAAAERFLAWLHADASDHDEVRLALPTGRTYVPFYRRLARVSASSAEILSRARGFNLDELVLPSGHAQSFSSYMREYAFGPTALRKERFSIPDVGHLEGRVPSPADVASLARSYDQEIQTMLPVDVALLGLGEDGHVAYNLPGPVHEETHVVELGEDLAESLEVDPAWRPLRAVTVGFEPLRSARRILLLAYGRSKAEAVSRLRSGPVDPSWPCTVLRDHPGLEVFVDIEAAG